MLTDSEVPKILGLGNWVSEKTYSRRLECGRLRDFDVTGCILARLAHRGRYQAVLLACCKSRLQWLMFAVEVCGFDSGVGSEF